MDDDLLTQAAIATKKSSSLEDLTRPFLGLLQAMTGLETTYLTEVDIDHDEQRILFSNNHGNLTIAEGLVVEWGDTLCRRALQSGTRATSDVPNTFPGSQAARDLGLQTYVSVPVVDEGNCVMGTLCGASSGAVEVSPQVVDVMQMLAQLIGDQWRKDKMHERTLERANQAEALIRERALFLAQAEHQLKTPLTILKGWSSMLADGWDSFDEADRTKALETMERAADNASLQVEQLLKESRDHILATELELSTLDISDVVGRVAGEMQGVTSKHKVDTRIENNVWAIADSRALWQVLWHLGENAIKYSPEGGTITWIVEKFEGDTRISLEDEGIGFDPEIDLFAPFTRAANEHHAEIAGTGLGLHVVRNLVSAMNGNVAATNRSEGGSSFTVRLPLA